MDFKTLLDPDNIYDILYFQRISGSITSLLSDSLGDAFPDLSAIWFIPNYEREIEWCKDWTDKVFNFLKPLTRTHLLNNGEFNGLAYGFTPLYTANFPSQLNIGEIPKKVFFKVKRNNTATITYLSRSHTVKSASYSNEFNNSITCYELRVRTFTADNTDDYTIELDSELWLINSCVITGKGQLIGITDIEKRVIMYEYLEETLSNINNQLQITDCKVLTGCDVTPERQFDNPIFEQVPDHYHYAFFLSAKGFEISDFLRVKNNGTVSANFGIEKTFFEDWKNTLSGQPTGYDFISDNPDFWNPKLLQLTINDALGSGNHISIFTTESNQSASSEWQSIGGIPDINDFYKTAYFTYSALPRLEDDWRLETFNDKKLNDKNCSLFRFKHKVESSLNFSNFGNDVGTDYFMLQDDFKDNHYDYSIFYKNNPYFTNTLSRRKKLSSATYPIIPEPIAEYEQWGYRTRYDAICLTFLGNQDYNLFSKGQVALIRPYSDTKYHLTETLWAYRDWEPNRFNPNGVDTTEITIKQKVGSQIWIIDIDLTDPDNAIIDHNLTHDILIAETDLPDTTLFPQPEHFATLESLSARFSLKRQFRANPINNIENIDNIVIDPDIDGGDIMPDSALAVRSEKMLISVCDALAISNRPDGTFKTFPPPKSIDNKNDIPDGWSFYSGNKDGYGIYEKRSRKLIINDFGKPEFLKGGYVQCFNILQRLEAMQDDNTRMIGGDEASGFLIPTADGRYIHYESLFQVIADMAYNQSWMTRSLIEIKINCMQLIHMGRDTLKAFGIPLKFKRLNIKLGEDNCQAAVPTLAGKTVTLSSQMGLILMNLGLLVGGNLKVTKVDTDGVGQSKEVA